MYDVVKEVLCGCGCHQAIVELRLDGMYQVSIYQLITEMAPGCDEACRPVWAPVSRGVAITDTVDAAASLAIEKLGCYCIQA